MEIQTQLAGLDRFLAGIYGEGASLLTMLDELGFEPKQSHILCEDRLPDVAGV